MDMTKLFITIHQFTNSPAVLLIAIVSIALQPLFFGLGSPNLCKSLEEGHNYAHQSLAASKTLVTAVFSQVLLN